MSWCNTSSRVGPAWCGAVCLALAGCGGTGLYPVEGRVLLDGQPLTSGYVVLHPEDGSPTPSDQLTQAAISAEGAYRVTTGAAAGVRPGRYRVAVIAQTNTRPPRARPNPMNLYPAINAKYFSPEKTPLRVEVTPAAGPGAYDLVVSR